MFFASQQAFDAGFGIFFIGFLVALLGFLALSFLEDAINDAQIFWRKRSLSVSFFWVGSICALFFLSGLAFWIMPKDAIDIAGPPQVSVLPYSTSTLGVGMGEPEIDLAGLLSNGSASSQSDGSQGSEPAVPQGELANPNIPGLPPRDTFQTNADSPKGLGEEPIGNLSEISGPQAAPVPEIMKSARQTRDNHRNTGIASYQQLAPDLGLTLPGEGPASPDDVALFVRSKVSSYWRGQTRTRFDGDRWLPAEAWPLVPIESLEGVWYNRESANLNNSIRYHQTFFIRQDHPQSLFMGYRGFKVTGGAISGPGVRAGDSYQVVSAQPRDNTQRLNQDRAMVLDPEYISLPPGLDADLHKIALQLGQGTETDFQRLERIVGYVAGSAQYDSDKPIEPDSMVPVRRFLLGEEPGGDLEFATAVTLLARASGLPARLALGYMPGVRDSLSGAYLVRVRDAHAWSEVYFANHGWVPFDSTPRGAAASPSDNGQGLNRWFQSGVSPRAPDAMSAFSSEIPEGLLEDLSSPLFTTLAAALALSVFIVRFLYPRWAAERRPEFSPSLAYAAPGSTRRRELLSLYAKAERQIRKRTKTKRLPWQTAMEYTGRAAQDGSPAQAQLQWFVKAVWQAAYSPLEPPASVVDEGKHRLSSLRRALKKTPGLAAPNSIKKSAARKSPN